MNPRPLPAVASSAILEAIKHGVVSAGTAALHPVNTSAVCEGEDILTYSSSSSLSKLLLFVTSLLSVTLECVTRHCCCYNSPRSGLSRDPRDLYLCSAPGPGSFLEDRSHAQNVLLGTGHRLNWELLLLRDTVIKRASLPSAEEKTGKARLEVGAADAKRIVFSAQGWLLNGLVKGTRICLREQFGNAVLADILLLTLSKWCFQTPSAPSSSGAVSSSEKLTNLRHRGFVHHPNHHHHHHQERSPPQDHYYYYDYYYREQYASSSAASSLLVVSGRTDLLLVHALCLLFSLHAFALLATAYSMGNEGSAVSGSESSTPLSEYNSMYSMGSRVRSSVESTRAPSPMEPPEPDLSHLTEEEVAKIKSVMDRAKVMQEEEQSRVRQLEEEYVNYATKIEREASLTDLREEKGKGGVASVCPICTKNQLPPPPRSPLSPLSSSRPSLSVCVDCQKLTCTECGSYHASAATKLQEWVCVVCERRRDLMMSTGLWYHGYHPDSDLPLAKKMTTQEQQEMEAAKAAHLQSAMTTSTTSRDSRDSRDSRGSRDSRDSVDSRRSDFSSLSAELNLLSMTSSQNSELARQMYEQSKVKGPGASLPKSESDDFSDLASDLDFDEIASERSRPDGSSTEEISRDFCVINHPGQTGGLAVVRGEHHHHHSGGHGNGGPRGGGAGDPRRPKHRPRSLNLSRSHSSTSDEDGEGDREGEAGKGGEEGMNRGGGDSAASSAAAMGASCVGDRKEKKRGDDSRAGGGGSIAGHRKDGGGDSGGREMQQQQQHQYQQQHNPGGPHHHHHHQQQKRGEGGERGGGGQHPPPPPPHSHSHNHHHHHGVSHPPPTHPHGPVHQLRDPYAVMPAEFVEASKINSPTPPRSPSWREGLESPPFSPRRRDSYPGKKQSQSQSQSQSRGSPVSPKDSKLQFTYGDISPPSRQMSLEELCDVQLGATGGYDGAGFGAVSMSAMSHKLSPKSPEELEQSFTTTIGQPMHFEMPPTRGAKTGSSTLASYGVVGVGVVAGGEDVGFSSHSSQHVPHLQQQQPSSSSATSGSSSSSSMMMMMMPAASSSSDDYGSGQGEYLGLPHSAPVMDLATYAATVANSTNCLTSMSVSPTTLLPPPPPSSSSSSAAQGAAGLSHPHQHAEPLSPDSVDSTDSTSSPVSPGYYDNVSSTSTEDLDELELADPASKSIDMGSGKRQKVRPPSTDWSPVIDLSPILDVSPSVEEAEQADMLAKQREELQRQQSREESEDMERDEEEEDVDDDVTMYSMSNSMSSSQDQSDVITNPFAFKLERRSGEDSSDGQEMMDFSTFSSLRRYEHLEDISRIGEGGGGHGNNNNNNLGGGPGDPTTSTASASSKELPEDEDARIFRVATEAAGAAIAAAIEEHQRLAKLQEDENGNPPSPNDDVPFPACTSQAQPAAGSSSGPVSSSAGMSGRLQIITTSSSPGSSGGNGAGVTYVAPEEEARSQRKALEAHISDEINKITQGMEDIVRRGAADIKPIPPPKPRRRLPDPTFEMTTSAAAAAATVVAVSGPIGPARGPPAVSPSLRRAKAAGKGVRIVEKSEEIPHITRSSPVLVGTGDTHQLPHREPTTATPPAITTTAAAAGATVSGQAADAESTSAIPRQDSAEKRKAKDLKAKPSPLLIQHIEAEEQSVSPHYRVMDSPPTPENKLIKREFSESTSVSPSSSPDNDLYMFPSPVTPPDSDSSPPKPHSPSSAGTDLDEDTLQYSSAGDLSLAAGGVSLDTYDPFSEQQQQQPVAVIKDVAPAEISKVPATATAAAAKRVPPPVPVRSKASGAGTTATTTAPPRTLPQPPVRSESVESEGGSEEGETSGGSIRDKIRAFEQVSCLQRGSNNGYVTALAFFSLSLLLLL